jgi:hypothetical protein
VTTQAFCILCVVLSMIAAPVVYHAAIAPAKIVGIIIMLAAAASAVLPVERALGRVLAALALIIAVRATWTFDAIGFAVLIAADATAGAVAPARRTRPRRARRWRTTSSARMQWIRLTVRSLSASAWLASLIAPVILVAFAYLIVTRNRDLDPTTAHRTVRVCGVIALATLASAFGSAIVRERPTSPWLRSLPWSSRDRVDGDALLHAALLFAVPVALVPLDWVNAGILALVVPAIAAATAAAIRVGAQRQTSAGSDVMLSGAAFGTIITLWPITSAAVLLATPLLLAQATRREQRLVATRWQELHHDTATDPAWTSAP